MAAKDRLALAADLPLPRALELYQRVSKHVGVVKVGLSLFVEHGPVAVRELTSRGARVFLDLKLHDIPHQVELAAARAGALGCAYLTIHASGGEAMIRAAVKGAAEGARQAGCAPPVVLAVTVLTSMDDAALAQVGVRATAAEQVAQLATLAKAAGAGGLVCSAREAAAMRALVGPAMVLCTPGIRPAGAAAGDQARVETPAAAIRAGADLLVVGRPITEAPDPVEAARKIEAELT